MANGSTVCTNATVFLNDGVIMDRNGGTATISFVRGNLVVSAPRSVHEMLSSQ